MTQTLTATLPPCTPVTPERLVAFASKLHLHLPATHVAQIIGAVDGEWLTDAGLLRAITAFTSGVRQG